MENSTIADLVLLHKQGMWVGSRYAWKVETYVKQYNCKLCFAL